MFVEQYYKTGRLSKESQLLITILTLCSITLSCFVTATYFSLEPESALHFDSAALTAESNL